MEENSVDSIFKPFSTLSLRPQTRKELMASEEKIFLFESPLHLNDVSRVSLFHPVRFREALRNLVSPAR